METSTDDTELTASRSNQKSQPSNPGNFEMTGDAEEGLEEDGGRSDLRNLRENYTLRGLRRADLATDPVQQFDLWFGEAREANLPEPNAMILATTGRDGTPTTRTVLLKAYDARGFVFFTNYRSAKARQIAENANVAMSFLWLTLHRQVNITGTARKVGAAESLRYFLSRPHGSQLGAWISDQSSVISSRQILRMKYEEMKRKFGAGKVPLPDHWGGYRIEPRGIEFWQGRPNRLHDRFRYRREGPEDDWIIERLAP